jgi:arsenate reductase
MTHQQEEWTVVYNCKGRLQGEMTKAFLEAQGIPALLSQEPLGAIYGFTAGELGLVQVLVSPENETKAQELLQAMNAGDFQDERLAACPTGCEVLGPQSRSIDDESLDQRKKVLFLCTGNSARSQMAEAIVNNDCWQDWVAYSAGTHPSGFVHPLTLRVLTENGIFHQGESKSVDVFKDANFDLVITVCDNAREECPLWLGKGRKLHVGFEDPAAVEGTEPERLAAFQTTFELMRAAIPAVLSQYLSSVQK